MEGNTTYFTNQSVFRNSPATSGGYAQNSIRNKGIELMQAATGNHNKNKLETILQ
jgi:hypothetical protein